MSAACDYDMRKANGTQIVAKVVGKTRFHAEEIGDSESVFG